MARQWSIGRRRDPLRPDRASSGASDATGEFRASNEPCVDLLTHHERPQRTPPTLEQTGDRKTPPRVTLTTCRHCCMRRATGATLLREATSELANSDDSAAFAELSALSSMCGCPRTMRCASCARDYTHGAELRAGGPQLPCLLAMAAAFLACPRWRPRRCHSRRPSLVASEGCALNECVGRLR